VQMTSPIFACQRDTGSRSIRAAMRYSAAAVITVAVDIRRNPPVALPGFRVSGLSSTVNALSALDASSTTFERLAAVPTYGRNMCLSI
jgi:hypothetical protein